MTEYAETDLDRDLATIRAECGGIDIPLRVGREATHARTDEHSIKSGVALHPCGTDRVSHRRVRATNPRSDFMPPATPLDQNLTDTLPALDYAAGFLAGIS